MQRQQVVLPIKKRMSFRYGGAVKLVDFEAADITISSRH